VHSRGVSDDLRVRTHFEKSADQENHADQNPARQRGYIVR
jgi:hypothetical protein